MVCRELDRFVGGSGRQGATFYLWRPDPPCSVATHRDRRPNPLAGPTFISGGLVISAAAGTAGPTKLAPRPPGGRGPASSGPDQHPPLPAPPRELAEPPAEPPR